MCIGNLNKGRERRWPVSPQEKLKFYPILRYFRSGFRIGDIIFFVLVVPCNIFKILSKFSHLYTTFIILLCLCITSISIDLISFCCFVNLYDNQWLVLTLPICRFLKVNRDISCQSIELVWWIFILILFFLQLHMAIVSGIPFSCGPGTFFKLGIHAHTWSYHLELWSLWGLKGFVKPTPWMCLWVLMVYSQVVSLVDGRMALLFTTFVGDFCSLL
jgi:hypothetical protein